VRVFRGVWTGAGAGVSHLYASGPGQASAASDETTLPLLSLHARYAIDLGFGSLAMGPELALVPARRVVQVHGRTLCSLPVATAGLVVELRLTAPGR